MNALAELKKRGRTSANPANRANQGQRTAVDSHDSHDSQGVKVEKRISAVAALEPPLELLESLKRERARLLTLAAAQYMDRAPIHRLHDLDVAACTGLDGRQLAAYLSLLEETAERHAGRIPAGHTAAIHCQHCGPVWTHPDVADVLPMVGGWPRALGCPWCFVRKAGGYIPRPSVACGGCQHFTPDTFNPEAGMGACSHGHGSHYPMARHACGDHSTRNPHEQA